eukprot:310866-Rhodomonas_salina.2
MATLRRRHEKYSTLAKFFQDAYGAPESSRFQAAQQNFVCSMAAYSIVTYVLQVQPGSPLCTCGQVMLMKRGLDCRSRTGTTETFCSRGTEESHTSTSASCSAEK